LVNQLSSTFLKLNLFFELTALADQILVKVIVESWFAVKSLGFIVFRSFKDSFSPAAVSFIEKQTIGKRCAPAALSF
jgi:hypothetical protein